VLEAVSLMGISAAQVCYFRLARRWPSSDVPLRGQVLLVKRLFDGRSKRSVGVRFGGPSWGV